MLLQGRTGESSGIAVGRGRCPGISGAGPGGDDPPPWLLAPPRPGGRSGARERALPPAPLTLEGISRTAGTGRS